MKKFFFFMFIILLSFAVVSCTSVTSNTQTSQKPSGKTNESFGPDESGSQGENTPAPAASSGNPVPTYTEDWPAEALPEGFPNLGKVTKVSDMRKFGNTVYIRWNMVTEDQLKEFVDKLNEYLDLDHEWQGYFYSDGVKYKPGTQEEFINVEIRYNPDATGAIEPELDAQLLLEITGEGLPPND